MTQADILALLVSGLTKDSIIDVEVLLIMLEY